MWPKQACPISQIKPLAEAGIALCPVPYPILSLHFVILFDFFGENAAWIC